MLKPHFSAECSRKAVHVAAGMLCLPIPWIFHSIEPVLALAAGAAALLFAVRAIPALRNSAGQTLYGISRRSYGEFAFIAGVLCAFVLAHGDLLAYVIPVAVLTFADAFAAIIGSRFGALRFKNPGGSKTFEGSAAFFAAAIVCTAAPLALAGVPHAMLVACITAVTLMTVEAVSWAGLDNLAIPLFGGLLMRGLSGGAL
jgi:phytol kinase